MLVFIPHSLLRNSVLYVMDLCIQERHSLIDFLSSYNKSKSLSLSPPSLYGWSKEQFGIFISALLSAAQTLKKAKLLSPGTSPWKHEDRSSVSLSVIWEE